VYGLKPTTKPNIRFFNDYKHEYGYAYHMRFINDVQHAEGCLIKWSTSYLLYTAYTSETIL